MNDAGYEAANNIVSKMLKKEADGETVRNPSALVHTMARNARHQIFPKIDTDAQSSKRGRHD